MIARNTVQALHCFPSWLWGWNRAQFSATAHHHEIPFISLAQEKIKTCNSKYIFYWVHISFTPSWSQKVINQTILSQEQSIF
jgi:hypothetical protein